MAATTFGDMDTLIETHGLTKRYGNGVTAVDGVTMTVRRGEVYGFLGPNGAGKTTTLRMLVGLVKPTGGTACVAGFSPGDPRGLRRIGSMIEGPGFYPYLSGRENLRVVADYTATDQKRVDEVLDEVDLLSRAHRKFGTYSMGMKQRIGVAAALLKDPELIVLDEPTNGLDPQGMAEMRKLVRDLVSDNRTVLLSSHLLGEVEHICDRVGVIRAGRLVKEASVEDLLGAQGVLVQAEPIDDAARILASVWGESIVTRQNGHIRLRTEPSRSWEIAAQLVQAGLRVNEVRPVDRSMEEAFFQLTGEKQG